MWILLFTIGGSVQPFNISKELEELALKAVKSMGLDIVGIDILFDDDKKFPYKICELNTSPGFEGFEQATGIDIAEKILIFCLKKCNKDF
jgi:gamma-F420-2:alpha-L-glutamate ligase